MEQLQNFLSAVFAEGAFTLLWLWMLIAAAQNNTLLSKGPYRFFSEGLATLATELVSSDVKRETRVLAVPGIVLLVVFAASAYPVGIVIQRLSDEHIETTSKLMLKEVGANPWTVKSVRTDQSIRQGAMVEYLPENDLINSLDSASADDSLTEQELRQHIKGVLENKESKADKQRAQKVHSALRQKLRSYRIKAFGDEGTRPYLRDALERVRITQAVAMHFWIVSVVAFSLALLSALKRPWRFGVLTVPVVTGGWAATAHESGSVSIPIALLYLGIVILLGHAAARAPGTRSRFIEFATIGVVGLVISFIATFAWSEYRTAYFESAIVLGSTD